MDQKTIAMAAAAAKTLWPARPTQWTREDVKLFKTALVELPKNSLNRWENIAEKLPDKSLAEIMDQYEKFIREISDIKSGRVELPIYPDDLPMSSGSGMSSHGDNAKKMKKTEKKGKRWSEQEHKLFLAGLNEFGSGKWRQISRKYVVTKDLKQVASHAQKYFLHLSKNEVNKKRKRPSIHDIKLVDSNIAPMVPIDQNCVPLPGCVGSLHQSQGMDYFPSNSMQDPMGSQMYD